MNRDPVTTPDRLMLTQTEAADLLGVGRQERGR